MTEDLKKVIMDSYLGWIRDNTFLKDLKSDVIKINSPFLDAHNDYITLYVKKLKNNEVIFTDSSIFYHDLWSYGIKLEGKKKELFEMALNSYGIKFDEETKEIYTKSDIKNIGRAKHRIIQCLITLNDLFNYTQQNIKDLFFFEVYNALREKEIQFTPNFQLRGSSGYEHRIDFSIGVIRNKEEQLIRLVSDPTQTDVVEKYIFSFVDLANAGRKFEGIIIYKGEPTLTFLDAIKAYKYKNYSWQKQKEDVIEMLNK
jgi:hypothetical protein